MKYTKKDIQAEISASEETFSADLKAGYALTALAMMEYNKIK